MSDEQTPQASARSVGRVGSYLIPLLLIFVLPLVSFFFFNHAEATYDRQIVEMMVRSIRGERTLSAEAKQQLADMYRQVKISDVLAENDPADSDLISALQDELKNDYRQFRWGVRLSVWSMALSVVSTLAVLVCVLLSLRSQAVQWISLSVGWHLLKCVCVAQILIQGILIVGLSFWVTALWFEVYILKLILVVALLVIAAVGLILKAMFVRVDDSFEIQAERLDLDGAPQLKDQIDRLCRDCGIASPDHVLVGIDDNFFVTEHPVTVGGRILRGKSLFLSISLLRHLDREEATAILAHEMAHFSGQDTLYSRKISPLLGRYGHYLEALQVGVVTLPVFYFMYFFWNLYQISLGRLSRRREFRADRIAAEMTRPLAVAESLARVQAYGHYRDQIERELFEQLSVHEDLDIARKVNEGFAAFVESVDLRRDVFAAQVPHPFDTHPPFEQRLRNVGVAPEQIDKSTLMRPVESSWYEQITDAEAIEERLWAEYEKKFKQLHEESLAYRLTPVEDWEIELVQKYFPDVRIEGKKKNQWVTLDYRQIHYSKWTRPVAFDDIKQFQMEEAMGGNRLTIKLKGSGSVKLPVGSFLTSEAKVIQLIQNYYGRALASAEHRRQASVCGSEDPSS